MNGYVLLALPPLALLAFAFFARRSIQKGAERIDRMKTEMEAKRQATSTERQAAAG